MNEYHLAWLKGELPTLVKKQILSQEDADTLMAYYDAQRQAERARYEQQLAAQREINARRLPVMLSVIAAVLIAGGVISLIAYNWAAISRAAKSVVAIALLLSVQGAGLFLRASGRTENARVRECMALLWALLFGAVVAFVSQIYRFPSNAASFAFVWAASSIALTYAFGAYSTFVLSLVQIAAYLIAGWSGSVWLLYPLTVALVPFVLRKNADEWQRYTLLAFAVMAALPMLLRVGFTPFNNALQPMLILTAYASIAVLFVCSEKKPLQLLGYAGLCALALLIVCHFVPTSAYDSHGDSYRLEWTITCVVVGGLFIASIAFPLYRQCTQKRWNLDDVFVLFPALSLAVTAIHSFVPYALFLCVLATLFVAYAFKRNVPWAYVFLALLVISSVQGYSRWTMFVFAVSLCVLALGVIFVRDGIFSTDESRIAIGISRILAAVLLCVSVVDVELNLVFLSVTHFSQNERIIFVLCALFAACGIACFVWRARKSPRALLPFADILFNLCAVTATIFAVHVAAAHGVSRVQCTTVEKIICTCLLLLSATFTVVMKNVFGKRWYGAYMGAALFPLFILVTDTSLSMLYWLIVLLALLFHTVARADDSPKAKAGEIVAAIMGGGVLLFIAVTPDDSIMRGFRFSAYQSSSYFVFAFFFLAVALFQCALLIKKRRVFNISLVLYALMTAVVGIVSYNGRQEVEELLYLFALPCILLFCLYYFYRAYKLHSAAIANCTAIYLALVLSIRFFVLGYGLVAQGITLIALGVFILAANRILARKKAELPHGKGEKSDER